MNTKVAYTFAVCIGFFIGILFALSVPNKPLPNPAPEVLTQDANGNLRPIAQHKP